MVCQWSSGVTCILGFGDLPCSGTDEEERACPVRTAAIASSKDQEIEYLRSRIEALKKQMPEYHAMKVELAKLRIENKMLNELIDPDTRLVVDLSTVPTVKVIKITEAGEYDLRGDSNSC